MKKLVLMFVAIAAISFASCGNKTAAPAANADSDTVQVEDTTASIVRTKNERLTAGPIGPAVFRFYI